MALLIITSGVFGQQNQTWGNYNWLIANWAGEGSRHPGDGGGTFLFSLDLDENILVRKSHSEYPAANGKKNFMVYIEGNSKKLNSCLVLCF